MRLPYARAETIADLNSETMEEGDYTVQSRHRYKHFSDPIGPYSSNKVFKQPVKQKKRQFFWSGYIRFVLRVWWILLFYQLFI